MANLITSGQKGWADSVNNFANTINNNSTTWSNKGITMLNGFSAHDSAGMIWSTSTIGDLVILTVKGSINYPDQASGASTDCLQLATNIFPVNKDFVYLHETVFLWGDQLIMLNFDNTTGKVHFTNESMRGDKTLPANTKLISLSVAFPM